MEQNPSQTVIEQQKKPSLFIIKLNPVDWLTLSGLAINSLAAVLLFEQQFSLALSLMLLAMLADAFDGILARKYQLERDFGRYLDGFVDVFTYLVLPALFLWQWCFNHGGYPLLLVVFMGCGVIRLSVFNQVGNVRNEQNESSYLGMPVFWSLLFLAPAWLASWFLPPAWVTSLLAPALAVVFSAFSLAMLLNRRFYKFKNPKHILFTIIAFSSVFALDGLFVLDSSTLIKLLITPLILIAPLVIAGSVHMRMVSNNWLPWLAIPIHRHWFGSNKTLRGLLAMPLLALVSAGLFTPLWFTSFFERLLNNPNVLIPEIYEYWLISLVLGLAYVLAELPNSFIKRRLGVAPGARPEQHNTLFLIADQLDSAIGVILVTGLLFDFELITLLAMLVMGPVIALLVKRVLFAIGWKSTAS
ncbi:CDP-archaeol synthase [Pelagibaculum spongiae]|uniref:CDP-diacylglycerol--serine O-phosphatidyltransferase n=1 Tax=Pelagibaculum spongiae TaxID=2080658 RepID=A0A2V1GZF9_9GAMM|nr:CDP-archaeol synthase [Pelagibaculum spongiae]PVZ72461.1 hypothetical protein DC094_05510 [Pelagibaculum spongiae]